MKNDGGYSLIELMIVVAIITILASMVIPSAGDSIAHTKEVTTLANLSTLRKAILNYATDHDGKYPQFAPNEVGATYSTCLHDALVPQYLREIPEAISPGWHHKTSHDVAAYWNQQGQDDNELNGMGRGWKYDANPASNTWGTVYVLCNHRDLKGLSWTVY